LKIATNPSGQRVYFDEKAHRYFVGDVILTSVTTWIDSFFPVFDAEKIAPKYAKKHGLNVEDVLAEWEKSGEQASELGNAVHAYADANLKGEATCMTQFANHVEQVDKAIALLRKRFTYLGSEVIVFSLSLGLAGTIDLLMQDKANGDVVVFDWKTNRIIEKENLWQHGSEPIFHLEDCNFNHYALQVNVYQRVLVEEDYYPGATFRRAIIHIQEDDVAWYKVGDMQPTIQEMLDWI
jgi:ATP-dependent exoDNAse (exonuclease V) beta subunit